MNYRIVRINPRVVDAEAVTFAAGTLTINVPQNTYTSGCPYCLRLPDPLPDTATIGSEVVVTIGAGTVEYPLLDMRGVPVTAERLRSGYGYPVAVVGNGANASFKLLAPLCYPRFCAAISIDGTEPAAEGGAA